MATHPEVLFDVRPPKGNGSEVVVRIEVRKRGDASAYVCHSEGLSMGDLREAVTAVAQAAKAL